MRCKAKAPKEVLRLTRLGGSAHGLLVTSDHVVALVHEDMLAKSKVVAIGKDGRGSTKLATIAGLGKPANLDADEQAVFFSQRDALYRAPFASADATVLAKPFPTHFGVHRGAAYGLRCDATQAHVVKVSTKGGRVDTVASFDHVGVPGYCGFGRPVIANGTLYAPELKERKIVRVDLEGGAVEVVADTLPFPRVVQADERGVVFLAAHGMYRVDSAAEPRLVIKGVGQWSAVATNGGAIFATDGWPKSLSHLLHRITAAGKAEAIGNFRGDIDYIAADEECVYLARTKAFEGSSGPGVRIDAMRLP